MTSGPLVSAIIPTYNRARIVPEAVDSVLSQTYGNVEVIVVDDGSTDDTQASLKQRYGSRVRVVPQANAGPSAARNHGIAVSRGELIAFLDSDDLWLPTKLERQVDLLQRAGKKAPCCLCNIMMRWSTGERATFDISLLEPGMEEGLWLNADEVLATRAVLFNQGIVIRREALEKTGGFDESLWLLEDHALALRLSLEGPWAFVREPLVIWRENSPGSLYQKAKGEAISWQGPMVQILEKQLALVQDSNRHKKLRGTLQRELGRARRVLAAAQMGQSKSWGTSAMGRALGKVEQYRGAFFRRSPWFPKMKTEPCGPRGIDIAKQVGAAESMERAANSALK